MKKSRKPNANLVPNWLLYSGLGVVFSLGALKIFWGLFRIYR